MSVAIQSHTEIESNKDEYDAEFDGEAVPQRDEEDSVGPSELCVDKETSCIYTY